MKAMLRNGDGIIVERINGVYYAWGEVLIYGEIGISRKSAADASNQLKHLINKKEYGIRTNDRILDRLFKYPKDNDHPLYIAIKELRR